MARSSAGAARSGCGGWALWSFPVCMDDELGLQEEVDWQSLPLLVQLSGSTSEQPKPTAIVWVTPPAVAAVSQIRSKCAHPLWTAARCNRWKYFSVAVGAVILHSIQVWLKNPKQLHYPFVHPQTSQTLNSTMFRARTGELWGNPVTSQKLLGSRI